MSTNFYAFILDSADDDIPAYLFRSDAGEVYSVTFDPFQYIQYVDDYPNLLEHGYGLSFFKNTNSNSRSPHDPMICNTIGAIINDFIKMYGNDVVLLYHCDHSDNRQAAREKIFNRWFNQLPIKNNFIKKGFEVEVMERSTMYYMGYITPINNPKQELIKDEFDQFAIHLMDK